MAELALTVEGEVTGKRSAVPRLLRRPFGAIGAAIIACLVVAALWPTSWLPHDPLRGDQSLRLLPPAFIHGGRWAYPLGTDPLGRDVFSRLVAGSRQTLLIVGSAALIALVIGVLVGLIAGYYRGLAETLLMFVVDIQLAFPVLVLLIAAVAAFGPSVRNLILILGFAGFAPYARLVRGMVLGLRERPFVEASRALGVSGPRIILRHLLPNCSTAIIVYLTFELAGLVLLEAALSFLGLGVQPPTPSWGGMIADSQQYMFQSPWTPLVTGLAIVLTVLAFNFLGDEIRDALDPSATAGS